MNQWLLLLTILAVAQSQAQTGSSSMLLLPSPFATASEQDVPVVEGDAPGSSYESKRYTVKSQGGRHKSSPHEGEVAIQMKGKHKVGQEDRDESGSDVEASSVPHKETLRGKSRDNELRVGLNEVEEIENGPEPKDFMGEAAGKNEDFRLNLVDLNLATGIIGQRSNSAYSYRRYSMTNPYIQLGADVWLKPEVGLSLNYFTNLVGSIANVTSENVRVPVGLQGYGVGILFRHFFYTRIDSPMLIYGISQEDLRLTVPADADERVGLKTSGVSLLAQLVSPRGSGKFWEAGVFLAPSQKHQEEATAANLNSGVGVDTAAVTFFLGSRQRLSKRQAFFWRWHLRYEVDQFHGAASQTDPLSGVTPQNVAVEQTQLGLQVGVSWGQ